MGSALFEISILWTLGKAHPSVPERALEYLINIGYDMEKQNDNGSTPFLHATTSYQPQVTTCLNTFVRRECDLHATDTEGQSCSALHFHAPRYFY